MVCWSGVCHSLKLNAWCLRIALPAGTSGFDTFGSKYLLKFSPKPVDLLKERGVERFSLPRRSSVGGWYIVRVLGTVFASLTGFQFNCRSIGMQHLRVHDSSNTLRLLANLRRECTCHTRRNSDHFRNIEGRLWWRPQSR